MGKLAITGGEKTVSRNLGLSWPIIDDTDRRLVNEVLESGVWCRHASDHPKVAQFEAAFAKFQDAAYGIAVTNGTTALECALKAVGVEAGDEVLVTTITYVASVTAVLLVNAIPVFVDVDPLTYNLSPQACEAAITPRTRAILAVDHAGVPCDMDALNELAARYKLALVTDCAHAHGSQWKGRGTGALGTIGTFSFQQLKTLSTGEGGMVVTNDPELAQTARSLTDFGRLPGKGKYQHFRVASNLRMHEFQGALGLAQLTRFEQQIAHREEQVAYLEAGLKEIAGLEPLVRDPRVTRYSFFYYPFRFISAQFAGVHRDAFLEALVAEGVPSWPGHVQPLWKQPLFTEDHFGRTGCPLTCAFHQQRPDYSKVHLPEAERIGATEACAMLHPLFLGPRQDMDAILEAMRKLREHTDELRTLEKERPLTTESSLQ